MVLGFAIATRLIIPANVRLTRPLSHTTTCSARRERRSENVPGNVFVDSSCIDCDICRWVAPETFGRFNAKSAVHTQPESEHDKLKALQAMVSCPTGSIRTATPEPLAKQAASSFPIPARDRSQQEVPDIYFNGYSSENTFGASSWLALSKHAAVIFDCPRYSENLAKNIEKLVGDRKLYLVLSHRDDVYGHAKWAERLDCSRIIHAAECNSSQRTNECEIKLRDSQFPYNLDDDFVIFHVPGHSKGSICLLHKSSRSLFSGDHIAFSSKVNELMAFRRYNSYSWDAQIESIAMLADINFKYIWPGHGRKVEFIHEHERREQIEALTERMRS
ncbi:hypothetical protein BWQ96_07946 [Gracilariopsis chorda]|uniref:Metallo-beta-lactamase domain-containing protein n=1 Tax=Gracilariopsis chorda TaxID=448386 RepID=A0A2V3IJR9_9FLOR|nr:hypothetical protein BWQ96_07946 [Gracilariopsis chorda]|eukprot:PXF42311.1 hypothetical protein BWQ96_07946 [Gracilariopsis chorda]